MSTIIFYKYQGTGNDFVMLDNTKGVYAHLSLAQIQAICQTKFGVGADGLIKINAHKELDFEVDYYNADGTKSFCGNGARCSVMFANKLGLIQNNQTTFLAIDGLHEAIIKSDLVELKMNDVKEIQVLDSTIYETNTGSPHFLSYFEDINQVDVVAYGKSIRYSDTYQKEGINVNLIQELSPKEICVYTYERGVENETLSCGTGVTAAALSFAYRQQLKGKQTIQVKTKGGQLAVKMDYAENFTDIWLIGPAKEVFRGEITIK